MKLYVGWPIHYAIVSSRSRDRRGYTHLLTYVNSEESCSLVSKLKIYVAYVRIMIMINSLNINDIDHRSDRQDDVESDCNGTRGLNLENTKTQWSLIIDWLCIPYE